MGNLSGILLISLCHFSLLCFVYIIESMNFANQTLTLNIYSRSKAQLLVLLKATRSDSASPIFLKSNGIFFFSFDRILFSNNKLRYVFSEKGQIDIQKHALHMFLQANMECRFTLKCVHDMARTYS